LLMSKKFFDADHYGLDNAKTGQEFRAHCSAGNLVKGDACQILCFVGPPGSSGKTIAGEIPSLLGGSANDIRPPCSLGGMRDGKPKFAAIDATNILVRCP